MPAGGPIQISFGLGGDRGPDIFADGYPTVREVACTAGLRSLSEPVEAEDWPDFRFVGDRYRYMWRTDRSWAGTCRELVFRFSVDGGGWTSVFVRFQ
jgi:hypothetical protein